MRSRLKARECFKRNSTSDVRGQRSQPPGSGWREEASLHPSGLLHGLYCERANVIRESDDIIEPPLHESSWRARRSVGVRGRAFFWGWSANLHL